MTTKYCCLVPNLGHYVARSIGFFRECLGYVTEKTYQRKPFRDLAKCVGKTLSRDQRVAYEHIEDMLVIKTTETDNVN